MLSKTPQVGDKIMYRFSQGRTKHPATVIAIEGEHCIFTLDGDCDEISGVRGTKWPMWHGLLYDYDETLVKKKRRWR